MGETRGRVQVQLTDAFWKKKVEVVQREVIPYQWKALNDEIPDTEPSHAIENFKIAAGESSGDFYGMVFQDSDVAKWLEAVAYSLEHTADAELESLADSVIDLIGRAQMEDGYINTYYTVKAPEKRWTNLRDDHELYCMGHLMEAAVAYYQATGKRKFVDIMSKAADHIDSMFGPEEEKLKGYPGHQEIELALFRLYEVTENERYLSLAEFFINERGREPHYFIKEAEERKDERKFFWNGKFGYNQSHLPVREQTKAVGHSVRAVYMYSAMADIVAKTGDEELRRATERLWKNVIQQQMYITAGIGSMEHGEAFSTDYDLPNDISYTETCATIGLAFWARRMLKVAKRGEYGDVLERALYNGSISGMDLDGKKFFYVNPLEVVPELNRVRGEHHHVKPVRQPWFKCACCPPNLARLITSINHYIYSEEENELFVHLYMGNDSVMTVGGEEVRVTQETNYPWEGAVKLTITPSSGKNHAFTLAMRMPGWCASGQLSINGERFDIGDNIKDGYVYINREWAPGDIVDLYLPMEVQLIHANPKVRENFGKVAIQRGPVVYCIEEADNGPNLHTVSVPMNPASYVASFEEGLLDGVVSISCVAEKIELEALSEGPLYKAAEFSAASTRTVTLKAIPYYAWANRGEGEMRVWLNKLK
ncbi:MULTISPECIES: glycoside hydrolase family 127 protein [Bacillaceae]|uniref:Glycoside hydrolase family 127 protein n=1 Tax=Evansella alkalicola TaxID=745819 RepID=A0ABS6JSV2_9BACI|nr:MULTISPECIES: beta-L-arabinofuranosidase domain-containing protein [Bacillaceae]MBU9721578.1 glycoside hydrolase family 127 protein [Bacillus alkalicola]